MLRHTLLATVLASALFAVVPANAASVIVGGQPMFPEKTIVENAVNSADHTTLVAAVKAAGLVDTLQRKALSRCSPPSTPPSTPSRLARSKRCSSPRTRTQLTKVLTYHVVPGKLTYNGSRRGEEGQGRGQARDRSGGWLMAKMNGPNNIIIEDEMGGMANITVYDVLQSNGVIHSIDRVLLPK